MEGLLTASSYNRYKYSLAVYCQRVLLLLHQTALPQQSWRQYVHSHFISPPHDSQVTTIYRGGTSPGEGREQSSCSNQLTCFTESQIQKTLLRRVEAGASTNLLSYAADVHMYIHVFSSVVPASGKSSEWKVDTVSPSHCTFPFIKPLFLSGWSPSISGLDGSLSSSLNLSGELKEC